MQKPTFTTITILVTAATLILAAVIFMQLPAGQGLALLVSQLGRPIGLIMVAILALTMGWALLAHTRYANQELGDSIVADTTQKDPLVAKAKRDDTLRVMLAAFLYFVLGVITASLLWILPLI